MSHPKPHERAIPIIESIVADLNMLEHAVNIRNNNFIECLPKDIVVEVPAIINKTGIHGRKLENYPESFGSLLNSQVGTIQLTTKAILNKSKETAIHALLADPLVENPNSVTSLIDTMIAFQKEYLGYLQ
jgi:alpha-galactosidase